MSDSDTVGAVQDERAAVGYVAIYLGLKVKIAVLEARATEAREGVEGLLRGEPGTEWKFPGLATVAVIKGRVSEKLDRTVLARSGVAPELLDMATVRTEGKPSLRISAAKAEVE